MKTFLYILLLTVLFQGAVFGNEIEPSVYTQTPTNDTNIEDEQVFEDAVTLLSTPNETNESNETIEIDPYAQKVFPSFESLPQTVYHNQVFEVKIKVIIAAKDFDDIQTTFSNEENLTVLNPNSKWQWFSDNIFFNTFYMKISGTNVSLPEITVHVNNGFEEIGSETLEGKTPEIVELNGDEK